MTRAQRLSASKIESLAPGGSQEVKNEVLNAFRHQRSNHPKDHREAKPEVIVLNAFRHQRSNHRAFWTLSTVSPRCSTPFGIKDRITADSAAPLLHVHVLNAFRHQRSNHTAWAWRAFLISWVLNAFRHQRSNHGSSPASRLGSTRSAQRLSASKIESLFPRPVKKRIGPTCSTPFGIKDRITFYSWRHPWRYCKCSTPFGIKDRITPRITAKPSQK